eukprot:gene1777-1980_t
MDFAKAFDSVPFKRLLLKLKQVGIRGKTLHWIQSFLSNRQQRVILQNGCSQWTDVISGVSPRSILGPILFFIYINDLPNVVLSKSKLDTWRLRFNAGKSVVLSLRNKFSYKFTLNGGYLEEIDDQKDLGILISNDLFPRSHIIGIVKKANHRIGMIRRCFANLTAKKVKTLYATMIGSVLEYGAPMSSPYYNKDIELLEKAQNRCWCLSNEVTELPSLETRRLLGDLCEVYKYLHGKIKTGREELFAMAERWLGGHSLKLHRPYARLVTRSNLDLFHDSVGSMEQSA